MCRADATRPAPPLVSSTEFGAQHAELLVQFFEELDRPLEFFLASARDGR
jgi:hypothetical protein